jgi:hypothetical protein
MDVDKFKRITDNPNFIPGIHNYCDRWCERCTFTARCSVYAIEKAELQEDGEASPDDPSFSLDKLSDMLRLTMAMVREQAEKEGIDLDAVLEEDKDSLRQHRRNAKEHPCVKKAETYRKAVGAWLDRIKPALKAKGEDLETQARLDLPDQDIEAEFMELEDALAVIQWYFIFIGVKLVRAASHPESDDPDEIAFQEDDANGCAKVALIAMDRSLVAWTQMRLHLPEEGDAILDFLVQLERLRKATEAWLPEARAFVRPGLEA